MKPRRRVDVGGRDQLDLEDERCGCQGSRGLPARQRQFAIADASSALRIILDGAETVTTPRAPNKGSMPGYAAKMTDQEIADVTTISAMPGAMPRRW
jgi:hypothetical protein